MLVKLGVLVSLLIPLCVGIAIDTPQLFQSNKYAKVTWSVTAEDERTDPNVIDMQLVQKKSGKPYVLVTRVSTAMGEADVLVPDVSGDGFQLKFVDVDNAKKVYARSESFSITA